MPHMFRDCTGLVYRSGQSPSVTSEPQHEVDVVCACTAFWYTWRVGRGVKQDIVAALDLSLVYVSADIAMTLAAVMHFVFGECLHSARPHVRYS